AFFAFHIVYLRYPSDPSASSSSSSSSPSSSSDYSFSSSISKVFGFNQDSKRNKSDSTQQHYLFDPSYLSTENDDTAHLSSDPTQATANKIHEALHAIDKAKNVFMRTQPTLKQWKVAMEDTLLEKHHRLSALVRHMREPVPKIQITHPVDDDYIQWRDQVVDEASTDPNIQARHACEYGGLMTNFGCICGKRTAGSRCETLLVPEEEWNSVRYLQTPPTDMWAWDPPKDRWQSPNPYEREFPPRKGEWFDPVVVRLAKDVLAWKDGGELRFSAEWEEKLNPPVEGGPDAAAAKEGTWKRKLSRRDHDAFSSDTDGHQHHYKSKRDAPNWLTEFGRKLSNMEEVLFTYGPWTTSSARRLAQILLNYEETLHDTDLHSIESFQETIELASKLTKEFDELWKKAAAAMSPADPEKDEKQPKEPPMPQLVNNTELFEESASIISNWKDIMANYGVGDGKDRICFIILLHEFDSHPFREMKWQNPEKFRALFDAIYDPDHYYVIHIDERAQHTFRDWVKTLVSWTKYPEAARRRDQAAGIERKQWSIWDNTAVLTPAESMASPWGSASLVYAEITSWVKALTMRSWDFDYIINLSMSEVPTRSINDLATMLSKQYPPLSWTENADVSEYRYQYVFSTVPPQNQVLLNIKHENLPSGRLILGKKNPWEQTIGFGLDHEAVDEIETVELRKGSQWHTFSKTLVSEILNSKAIMSMLFAIQFMMLPDECFFATAAHHVVRNQKKRPVWMPYAAPTNGNATAAEPIKLDPETDKRYTASFPPAQRIFPHPNRYINWKWDSHLVLTEYDMLSATKQPTTRSDSIWFSFARKSYSPYLTCVYSAYAKGELPTNCGMYPMQ
ncbi:hypothetical protein HK102_005100, partial [Quaeritorhiza haematococci]